MKAAINASPLIFLAKLNKLELLYKLFSAVYTTQAVRDEVAVNPEKHPEAVLITGDLTAGRIKVINPRKILAAPASIDRGELSVLSLAKEYSIENVILDDYKAIQAAKSLGLKPISTIFILVKAYKLNLITKNECLLAIQQLSANGYYISIELYQEIEKKFIGLTQGIVNMRKITEKIVLEARRKGYSIRKVAESTGVPYNKVLAILAKTQVDEELYPGEE